MGFENSTNDNNKKKPELKNDYEGLGPPRQQPSRQRLNSDPQQEKPSYSEKLQPIRRHSNASSNNLQNNLNYNNSPEQKDTNLPHKFERNSKRRLSQQYCSDFKKQYLHQSSNTLLTHLACSLNQTENKPKLDYEHIRKYYVPQYMLDWRYVDDKNTGVKCWKNYGKIVMDSKMFEKVRKLASYKIGASEPFYLKRSWLFSYLIHKFGKFGYENPVLTINKNNVFEDSYNKFIHTPSLNLTKQLKIRFIDEKQQDEEGIYREWYSLIFKELISTKLKLFRINPYKCCEPNTIIFYPKYPGMKFEYYVFIGKMIIKAILDLMTVRNAKINVVLLKAIVKRPITLNDIKYYNLDLYQKLKYINDNKIQGNPQLQNIRFVWAVSGPNNTMQEVEIVPQGNNIFLNDSNKYTFIDKVIYTEAIKPYEEHIQYLHKGIYSIFEKDLEGIFSVEELLFLLSGQDNIDLNDWQENTIYKGCYNPNHPVIIMFWNKIKSLNKNEIIKFLQFSTGSGSVPIDGFASLKGIGGKIQKFTIEPFTNYSSENPDELKFQNIGAKRCYHTIILPLYNSKQQMDMAINNIIYAK